MKASIVDADLRNLLLATLVSINVKEARATVLPENTLAHVVDQATFDAYRSTLGGLTAQNQAEVREKLANMGIDGRGSNLPASRKNPARTNLRSAGDQASSVA